MATRELAFEKWEGLGNDFILVEADALLREQEGALIRALCDRRRGIGADGVLILTREDDGFRMIVRNADGSRPEMCGNGIRCVAGYLARRHGGERFSIGTDAGPRACRTVRTDAGLQVSVDMGVARIAGELRLEVDDRAWTFARVDVGNPHAITFEPMSAERFDRVAKKTEHAVPGGTNVELVRVDGAVLDVVVWERGVGYTQACGTGACAVAAVACATNRAKFGEAIMVRLPGGVLELSVTEGFEVTMTGPATRVFAGTVSLD